MLLRKDQWEVREALENSNIVLRTGRRWGKTTLSLYLWAYENVALFVPNTERLPYGKKCKAHTNGGKIFSADDMSGQFQPEDYDLIIFDDASHFPVAFWSNPEIKEALSSTLFLMTGTSNYANESGKEFALAPFRENTRLFSYDSYKNDTLELNTIDSVRSWMQPDFFGIKYLGH